MDVQIEYAYSRPGSCPSQEVNKKSSLIFIKLLENNQYQL